MIAANSSQARTLKFFRQHLCIVGGAVVLADMTCRIVVQLDDVTDIQRTMSCAIEDVKLRCYYEGTTWTIVEGTPGECWAYLLTLHEAELRSCAN